MSQLFDPGPAATPEPGADLSATRRLTLRNNTLSWPACLAWEARP